MLSLLQKTAKQSSEGVLQKKIRKLHNPPEGGFKTPREHIKAPAKGRMKLKKD